MFERYSDSAKRVIFFGRYAALQADARKISPTHLMVGVVYELHRNARPLESVFRLHAREGELRDSLGFVIKQPADPKSSVQIPLDDASKKVLAFAAEEARKLDHYSIEPEHLILGTLREENPSPNVLKAYGIELNGFREWVRGSYGGRMGAPQPTFSISLIGTILVSLLSLSAFWLIWVVIRSW